MIVPGLQVAATGGDLYIYIRASEEDVAVFDKTDGPTYPVKVFVILDPNVDLSSSLGPVYSGGVQQPSIPAFLIDRFHPDSVFEVRVPSTSKIKGPGGAGGRGQNSSLEGFVGGGGGGGGGAVAGDGGAADAPAIAGQPGGPISGGAHGTSGVSGAGPDQSNLPGADGGVAMVLGAYRVFIKNEGEIASGGGGGFGAGTGTFAFPDGVAGGDIGEDAAGQAGDPLTGFAGKAIEGSNYSITGGGSVLGPVDPPV